MTPTSSWTKVFPVEINWNITGIQIYLSETTRISLQLKFQIWRIFSRRLIYFCGNCTQRKKKEKERGEDGFYINRYFLISWSDALIKALIICYEWFLISKSLFGTWSISFTVIFQTRFSFPKQRQSCLVIQFILLECVGFILHLHKFNITLSVTKMKRRAICFT